MIFFSTDRVLIQRLILEYYDPDIEYITGYQYKVADAISILILNRNQETAQDYTYK